MPGPAAAPAHRPLAVVLLVVAGFLSLPVVATFLDGDATEAWVVPVQLLLMAAVGAVVGRLLPGLAGAGATPGRATAVGAAVGVAAGVVAAVVFMVLLGGP